MLGNKPIFFLWISFLSLSCYGTDLSINIQPETDILVEIEKVMPAIHSITLIAKEDSDEEDEVDPSFFDDKSSQLLVELVKRDAPEAFKNLSIYDEEESNTFSLPKTIPLLVNFTSLETLKLSGLKINTADMVLGLAESLSHLTSLKSIDLSNCDLGSYFEHDGLSDFQRNILRLFEAIADSPSITQINMSSNENIFTAPMRGLRGKLKATYGAARKVYMSDLCEALFREGSCLEDVDLSSCNMGGLFLTILSELDIKKNIHISLKKNTFNSEEIFDFIESRTGKPKFIVDFGGMSFSKDELFERYLSFVAGDSRYEIEINDI